MVVYNVQHEGKETFISEQQTYYNFRHIMQLMVMSELFVDNISIGLLISYRTIIYDFNEAVA